MKTLKKPAGHALRYGAMLALALGLGVSSPGAQAEDLVIGVGTLGTFEWAPSRNGEDNNLIAAHWSDPFIGARSEDRPARAGHRRFLGIVR